MKCKDCLLYQNKEADFLRWWREAPSIAQWTKNNKVLEELERYLWEIRKFLMRIADEECSLQGCLLR